MKRNFKLLGLLAVAALAMSAVAASAAQAAGQFDWESGTTKLTASAVGIQKFTTDAGTVECNEVSGQVATSGTGGVTSVTATNIVYKNNGNASCPLASFGNATITFHSCDYKFLAGETEEGTNDSTLGSANIECSTKGDVVEVTAPFGACTIKIPAQTGLSSITYKDTTTATPKDVDLIPNIKNIRYSYSGFLCGSGENTNGTYTGEVTVKGENSSNVATGVWVT
jgi:hypothetical protein